MKAKSESEVALSCRTLWYPMDCSLPGSSIHGIFQARVLEWGAISFSIPHTLYCNGNIAYKNRFKSIFIVHTHVPHCTLSLSCARLFVIPWTVAHQAPLSMGILQARILEWVSVTSSRGSPPTQRLNPGLPHCRQILYHLSHQGSPWILEWRAYPFSRGSLTRFFCIAGRFFYQLSYQGNPKSILACLFIYFWLFWVFAIALRLSLVAMRGNYSLFIVLGLLIVVACLAVQHGLRSCGSGA